MQIKVAFAAMVVTVVAYLAWLGWDRQRNPDGTGPYEAWQVAGLALTLAVVAAASSWRLADAVQSMVVATMMAAVLTVAWSIGAATEKSSDANLWPIGAIFLAIGSSYGLIVVAALTRAVQRWTHRL